VTQIATSKKTRLDWHVRKDTMTPAETPPHILRLNRAVPEPRRSSLAEELGRRIPGMSVRECAALLSRPGTLVQSRRLDRLMELKAWLEGQRVSVEIVPFEVAPIAPPEVRSRFRFGIQSRLLLMTLVPVLLVALAVSILGGPSLERSFALLLDRSAAQVAYTVASSLRPDDLTGTIKQLDLIGSYENIGFIEVRPQDDPRLYLAYRDPAYGLTWRVVNRDTAPVRRSNDPGDQILRALQTDPNLRSLNVQDARLEPVRQSLNSTIRATGKRLEPFDHQSRVFAVREARVFEAQNGIRTVLVESSAAAPGGANPVFSLRIGVFDDQARALGAQQLRAVLLLLAISLVVASLLAFLAARSVSRPITSLIAVANQISLGDLQQPVARASNDEIGDLSEAIERMRTSLNILIGRHRARS
jgi:HAMP domain-containing protein